MTDTPNSQAEPDTQLKWYMTIGLTYGEYAVKAESIDCAKSLFGIPEPYYTYQFTKYDAYRVLHESTLGVREVPPDVAEWLDAGMHEFEETHVGFQRMKVAGGWMWHCQDTVTLDTGDEYPTHFPVIHSMQFVPVPHTANITVIGGGSGE